MPDFPEAIPLTQLEQFLLNHFVPVQSTYCVAIAYNPNVSAVRIKYDDGRIGVYFPVSEDEAKSLFYAPSKGKWVWSFLRIRGTRHGHQRGFTYE